MKLVTHANDRLTLQDGPPFFLFGFIALVGLVSVVPGISVLLTITQSHCTFGVSVSSLCLRSTVWSWTSLWYSLFLALLILVGGVCIGGGALWALAYTATHTTFTKKHEIVLVRHLLPYYTSRHALNEVKAVFLEETWDDSDNVLYRICLLLTNNERLPLTGFHPGEQEVTAIAQQVRTFLAL